MVHIYIYNITTTTIITGNNTTTTNNKGNNRNDRTPTKIRHKMMANIRERKGEGYPVQRANKWLPAPMNGR